LNIKQVVQIRLRIVAQFRRIEGGVNTVAENPTVVFPKPGEVILEQRSIPEPGHREVLVENIYSLISTGTEITHLSGEYPAGSVWDQITRYPYVPGYNSVARVVGVGADTEEGWMGEIVACRAAHSRYDVQFLDGIHRLPGAVQPEQASFYTMAQIALNAVRRSDLRLGESVVIFGMGIVGHLAALFGRLCGACPVIAVDTSDYRLGLLPKDRLLKALNPKRSDLHGSVEANTLGRMADVVIEATGNADLIPKELEVLKEQGRFVILSSPRGKTEFDFHDLCCWPSITILGSHNRSHPETETLQTPWTKARHGELLFILIATKQLDLQHMITHRIGYGEAPAMYRKLLSRKYDHLGVVIRWED
jgi:2-desacetyl-2-hydroxyethyl bacteriochlorophyllide A dehydrogenase